MRKILLIIVAIVATLLLLIGCMQFRHTDRYITRQFKNKAYQPTFYNYRTADGQTVHYWGVNLEQEDRPLLLFIHGAPGSSTDFLDYLLNDTLAKRYRLLSVDRLGYGYSNFGHSTTSISQQAQALSTLFERHSVAHGVHIVAHSYGCAVAAYLLANYPTIVRQAILVSPVIDPNNEKVFGISYWANRPWLRPLVPDVWHVANDEKLQHAAELQKMLPIWANIKQPIVVLYGAKDWIAPIANADFAEQHCTQSPLQVLRYPNLDHFIPFTHPDLITRWLIQK